MGCGEVDLAVDLGPVHLANPVMTASGTAGYGSEFAAILPLHRLGAHVVKSLASFSYPGNPPPRLAAIPAGMINSVGLPGPGAEQWSREHLPGLLDLGVNFAVSIWGRSVEEFLAATAALSEALNHAAFCEINVSCPNSEANQALFSHDPGETARVVSVVRTATRAPLFTKLSPNTDRYTEVAAAAISAGSDGLTAINTVFGQWIEGGKGVLGRLGGGGVSGRGIHPIALRVVSELRSRFPEVPLIGVGGISTGRDALRMLQAGANAVQVGTATFVDPRRPYQVLLELESELRRLGIHQLKKLA